MAVHKNKHNILIQDLNSYESYKLKHLNPYIVILTSEDRLWNIPDRLKKVIVELIDKGTKYFFCVGNRSEKLHDDIDEIIYSHYFDNNLKEAIDIITCFEEKDYLDIISCCFYGVDMKQDDACILALLDFNKENNLLIKQEIKAQMDIINSSINE